MDAKVTKSKVGDSKWRLLEWSICSLHIAPPAPLGGIENHSQDKGATVQLKVLL